MTEEVWFQNKFNTYGVETEFGSAKPRTMAGWLNHLVEENTILEVLVIPCPPTGNFLLVHCIPHEQGEIGYKATHEYAILNPEWKVRIDPEETHPAWNHDMPGQPPTFSKLPGE